MDDKIEVIDAIRLAAIQKGRFSKDAEHGSFHIAEVYDEDTLALAKTGKKQVLQRRFGLMSMTGFSCGLMATWEGLLVTFSLGLQNGGPAGLLYGFLIAWAGTLSVFISMGELSSMVPTAGGQYHWVNILSPRSTRKFLSYVTGWITVTGWIAALAATAFFTATLIQAIVGQNHPTYTAPGWQGTLFMWATLLICVFINTVTSGVLPAIEILVLILHVLGFFAIIIPLIYLAPHGNAKYIFSTFYNDGNWSTKALSFFIGLKGNAAAFVGTDGAIHMSEEIRGASRNVARSMVLSVLINGVLAFGMLLAVLFCAGDIDAAAQDTDGYPFIAILAQGVRSAMGATVMTSIVIVLSLCAAIGSLAAASRMLWAFARDAGLPWHRLLSHVNRRTTVPVTSIAAVTILAALLGLINVGSSAAFNDVVSLVLQGFYMSYFIALSLLLYRRVRREILEYDSEIEFNPSGSRKEQARFSWGPWRIRGWLGVLNNAFACAYLIVIWIMSFWPPEIPVNAQNMNYSCLVLGGVVIGSVIYYFARANKVYRGPIAEVNVQAL
ncbi:MAG: hypothetical protein M1821_001421 [Bathelium mastoideum]|nr:MAG: hypothetical protein M1821_001421 [Bathelium mastoideum]KAI9689950.1 MAG: hypothetical protein M1822_009832 [Bathelium mastoideum]